MQKKSKTILTAVVTALFVLSVSYFALLAPTTAWYYQKEDIAPTEPFEFGYFDVEQTDQTPASFQVNVPVVLRDATRFADAGETLFDEMIHVVKVEVQNTGYLDACVVPEVKVNSSTKTIDGTAGEPDTSSTARNGLRWFICESATSSPIAPTAQDPSPYKTKINTMLTAKNSAWPIDYKTGDFSAYTGDTREAQYEAYNAAAVSALNAYNNKGAPVATGDTKTVYVVFWAEYGELKTDFEVSAAESARHIVSLNYDVTLNVVAKPDVAQSTTLTITNTETSDIDVTLYLMQENGVWDSGTQITVPASDAVARTLDAGTQYRLTVASNAGVHFGSSGTATTVIGTLSNAGDGILIAPNA